MLITFPKIVAMFIYFHKILPIEFVLFALIVVFATILLAVLTHIFLRKINIFVLSLTLLWLKIGWINITCSARL